MIGARVNISSLTDEDSEEAQNCNLLYTTIRRQVLGMAFWNFARRTKILTLLKAAPGATGSLISGSNYWSPIFPAPPWVFEYSYPADCIQARYIVGQDVSNNVTPIFSTQTTTYSPYLFGPPAKFIVADDVTGVTNSNNDFANCDATHIVLATADRQVDDYYNNQTINLDDQNGHAWTGFVADYVNATNKITFAAVTGGDALPTFIYGPNNYLYNIGSPANVILTNQQNALLVYTANIAGLDLWGDQALQALVSALAGFLAVPIAKDRGRANELIQIANRHILEARATDGNEGLTTQDSIPDWIRARGGMWESFGYFPDYIPQYPPLFAIS